MKLLMQFHDIKFKLNNHSISRNLLNMHILQPKHQKLKEEEAEKLLKKFNILPSQLPKIKITDPTLPEGCRRGDIIKIERKLEGGQISLYYRVVV